ncbi:MAG TPA: DUF4198 domain-containing protein [Thermoanaerobaculia bacterium]|nr:DUF4198 domain-containing protein [Thermoanaerobaculia bacterium]
MRRLLLCTLFALSARAHDFWIEPSSYRPAEGERVQLTLRVGEDLKGDPVPRMAHRIESFVLRDVDGERAIVGIENVSPAGVFTAGKAPAVIGYRSNFAEVELPRAKFEAYLREEGLENRIVVRDDGIQRERYARFAKSLSGATGATEPFGWRFELVPLDATRFRALYEQKPLAGTLVVALSRDGKRLRARTDADGVVRFDLTPGEWLVKTVHMVPATGNVQWESLWASVTLVR